MFKQFNKQILPKLNVMWSKIDGLVRMRSDKYINIKRAGNRTTLSLNLQQVRRGLSFGSGTGGYGGTGGGSSIFRAACTEDAGIGSAIDAALFKPDGTAGEAIEVTCNISNGADLNDAVPRLEDEDVIYVRSIFWDDSETPTQRWECVTNFQGSEDCLCVDEDAVFNSVTIAADEPITFDGVGGDSYYIYNSTAGEMEHYVDGVKVSTW